jgi:hypothetical protein
MPERIPPQPAVVVVDRDELRVQQVHRVADQTQPAQEPGPPDVPEGQPDSERGTGQQQREDPLAFPQGFGLGGLAYLVAVPQAGHDDQA